MVYYKHARLKSTLDRILEEESNLGHHLKSAVMADMLTRYDLVFEDSEKHYQYHHECCRRSSTLVKLINQREAEGYKLVFHIMSDLATRHELFFEKEK